MFAVEDITITLEPCLVSTLATVEETLNNAVAAYAVKNRLALEEVAAYCRGFRLIGSPAQKIAMYQICQLKLEKKRAGAQK